MITPLDRSILRASSRNDLVQSFALIQLALHASLEGCLIRRQQDGPAISLDGAACNAFH